MPLGHCMQGLEDHVGDMDFKIAGTRSGITAIQLDIKPCGIPLDILCEALEPAQVAREHILDHMEQEIREPNTEQKENAPRRGMKGSCNDSSCATYFLLHRHQFFFHLILEVFICMLFSCSCFA